MSSVVAKSGVSQRILGAYTFGFLIFMFAPLGFVRGLSDEQMSALAQGSAKARAANLPTMEDGVKAGSWLCGPAESVTEKLLDVQSRYPGLEQINVGSPVGTPQSVILEQLERFAKEVMPAFKK